MVRTTLRVDSRKRLNDMVAAAILDGWEKTDEWPGCIHWIKLRRNDEFLYLYYSETLMRRARITRAV